MTNVSKANLDRRRFLLRAVLVAGAAYAAPSAIGIDVARADDISSRPQRRRQGGGWQARRRQKVSRTSRPRTRIRRRNASRLSR